MMSTLRPGKFGVEHRGSQPIHYATEMSLPTPSNSYIRRRREECVDQATPALVCMQDLCEQAKIVYHHCERAAAHAATASSVQDR